MCPSYLDGDQATKWPGDTRYPCPKTGTPLSEDRDGAHAVSMDADVGIAVQFSRSAEKAPAGLAAGLSKLNSMQAPRKRSALSRLGRHARRVAAIEAGTPLRCLGAP